MLVQAIISLYRWSGLGTLLSWLVRIAGLEVLVLWIVSMFKSSDADSASTPKICSHRSGPSSEPCQECIEEKRRSRKYRWKVIIGLVFPAALHALDVTIIASALPWIAGDFGKISQLNWIAAAFNLTSASFIPFWAQMADVFGRNATLNASLIIILIGSAMCTGAPTNAFPLLLLGRALQGVAAAGLEVLVQTILADKVSLQENAKNWSIFALVDGVAYGMGPVIGGYLTNADWRWCFGINLPIGAVSLVVVFFLLRKELLGPQPIEGLDDTVETGRRTRYAARLKSIDFGGQMLFLCGFGLIILGLTWGGATYPWASAAVIVSLSLGCLLAIAFFYWESLFAEGKLLSEKWPWQRAMMPWNILTNRDIGLLFYTEIGNGIGMFSVLYFCNIFFISVKDYRADESGVQLLYFMPGIAAGVWLCSYCCNGWPRMTWPTFFFGALVQTIGVGMLAYAMYTEHSGTVFGMMALVGFGTGLRFMSTPLHGVGIFRRQRAAVIGLLSVAFPLGGTLGLTVMSTVFNNTSRFDSGDDFSAIRDLPPSLQAEYKHSAKMGVVWSFVAITPFLLLAWFCTFFLGNVKLGHGYGPDEDGAQNTIIKEVYLLTLFRGGRSQGQHDNVLEEEMAPVPRFTSELEARRRSEGVDPNRRENPESPNSVERHRAASSETRFL